MDKSIVMVLDELRKKVEKVNFSIRKKEKFKNEINYLIKQYDELDSVNGFKDTYDSIVKKGRELTRETNYKEPKKVEYYLNYCHAALYDFKGNVKDLNWLIRCYLISSVLFLVLSPQYLGSMVPLILLIPIYLGLKGMKKRSMTGFMYGMSAMPMALLTSVMVLKFEFWNNRANFAAHVAQRAQDINRSIEFTQNLMTAVIILSVVLLVSSVATIVIGSKNRRMFV